ncbi:MAG: YggT family protein [Candidatus Methylumidiphilus sp.]
MSSGYLSGLAVFLIDTAARLYIFALMLRFLLQWQEADFYNPISQFLVKVTHPPLRHLRRAIPSIGRADTASLVLMLALQALDLYLVSALQQTSVGAAGLLAASAAELLELLYYIFFWSIFISVALSWVVPRGHSPAIALLHGLTEPFLSLFRRVLPPMGGIDLSPLLALFALELARRAVLEPLQDFVAKLN